MRSGPPIAGYDLVRELARGGMGVVHEARDRATDRPVALKVLLAVSDPEARARFRVEGEAAARLRHPGIVAVHSAGEAGGVPYLVMDLVQGETLEARLKRAGPFDVGDAVRIVEEAACALAHAHAQGIVHRDLKPSNVMIDHAGRALLTDFGVAKLSDGAPLTRTGDLLGTPSFMAPEQLDGRRADARTDVYGLGATLFSLLTGRPPFEGALVQTLTAVVSTPPPRPSSLRPDLPRALDELVLSCLQKDPARRPASMAELAQALRSPQLVAPVASRVSPALLVLAALALLTGGAAMVVAWWRARPPQPAVAARAPVAPVAPVAPMTTAADEGSAEPPPAPMSRDEFELLWGKHLIRAASADDTERLVDGCEQYPELLGQALVWRAKSRRDRTLFEAALEDLARLRTVAPDRAEIELELRIELLCRLDRPDAVLLIDEALTREELATEKVVNLAMMRVALLQRLARPDEARAGLRAVLGRMPPEDDRLLVMWAAAGLHGSPAELNEIVDVLGPASERRPTLEVLRQRAMALFRVGRLPEAIAELRRAIALAPGDGDLHLSCAQLLLAAGDHAAAATSLEAATAADPEDLPLRNQVATHYEQLNALEWALLHRRAALALAPQDPALRAALTRTERLIAARDGTPPR